MEIGDVQKKDIVDHPENYTLLTTLDEGLSRHAVQPPRAGPIPPAPAPAPRQQQQQLGDDCSLCFRDVEEV